MEMILFFPVKVKNKEEEKADNFILISIAQGKYTMLIPTEVLKNNN